MSSRAEGPAIASGTNSDHISEYQDGFVAMAPFGPLPGFNPFWAVYHENPNSVHEARYDLSMNPDPNRPLRLLKLASSSPLLTEEQRHEDDSIRLYAQCVYFRCFNIKTADIPTYIMSARISTCTNLYTCWILKCQSWKKDWQHRSFDPRVSAYRKGLEPVTVSE